MHWPGTAEGKVVVAEPAAVVFKRLVAAKPPGQATAQLDTACVLGGSIAGLTAARALADHARQVITIERDIANRDGRSRAGLPQDQRAHGAERAQPDQFVQYLDGRAQVPVRDHRIVTASRPLIESWIRAKVFALANVLAVRAP
jgi:hypothetical protein